MSEDQRDADRPSAGLDREAVARIISGPWCDATGGDHTPMNQGPSYRFCTGCGESLPDRGQISHHKALAKADAILALAPTDRVAELEGALRQISKCPKADTVWLRDDDGEPVTFNDTAQTIASFARALLPSEERGSGK